MPKTLTAAEKAAAAKKRADVADAKAAKADKRAAVLDAKAAKADKAAAAAARAAKKAETKQTHREKIVELAHWFYEHGAAMPYTESAQRASCLHHPVGTLPNLIDTDCSGFVTLLYAWAGCLDPNGLNHGAFNHAGAWTQLGYTGTLLDHAYHHGEVFTDLSRALPGDLIVYGPGTGAHVEVVVKAGKDPVVVGHGYPGVHFTTPSRDGREPVRVCRYIKAAK